MNSIDLQKIIGAVLGTFLFIMSVGFLAESLYHVEDSPGGGYTLEGADASHSADDGHTETADAGPSLASLLASADAAKGEKLLKKCSACHTFEVDGGKKVGPALYDVVGRQIGSVEGFGYSDVLADYNVEGRTWTYEDLDAFLKKPKEYAPKTKMSFPGFKKGTDRANFLAYLQSLSEAPVAFPTD